MLAMSRSRLCKPRQTYLPSHLLRSSPLPLSSLPRRSTSLPHGPMKHSVSALYAQATQLPCGSHATSRAHFANVHALVTVTSAVAQHHGASVVTCRASPGPSDTIRMVPEVLLFSSSKVLSGLDELIEVVHLGHRRLRVSFGMAAIQISQEDAGVSLGAQEDERIGQRLESSRDGRRK